MLTVIKFTETCRRYWSGFFIIPIYILMLSGCSVMPSFNESTEPEVAQSSETQETLSMSSQDMLANALLEAENRYVLAKRTMTVEQTEQFENAIRLFNSGNVDDASEALAPLLTGNNVSSAVWVLNGDIALNAGNTKQAVSDFHNALGANPFNYFALNRLGMLYREKGQFTTASNYYKQAVAAWPGFANIYYNAGILHDLYLGEKQTAIAMYENYLALIAVDVATPEKEIRTIERWIADAKRKLSSNNDLKEQ
ncbi:tetratricopeptide repeat protein [Alteromonas sp.]|nr:tetratricopeptide repeat protein [Alteromonas sp.]